MVLLDQRLELREMVVVSVYAEVVRFVGAVGQSAGAEGIEEGLW